MSKSKSTNTPGIHLFTTTTKKKVGVKYQYRTEYYWNIISKNGREIARSSETYTRKANAVKSIRVAAEVFRYEHASFYFDHSKPIVEQKSYWGWKAIPQSKKEMRR